MANKNRTKKNRKKRPKVRGGTPRQRKQVKKFSPGDYDTTKKPKKRGSRKKTDVGAAPNWPEFLAENPTDMEIYNYHSFGMNWYNYNHKPKDLRKDVEIYLKKQTKSIEAARLGHRSVPVRFR